MCTFGFSVRGLCGEIYSVKFSLAVLRFSSAGISGERSTRFQDDPRAMQELPERRKSSVQVAVPAPELWKSGQPDSWPGPIHQSEMALFGIRSTDSCAVRFTIGCSLARKWDPLLSRE